MLPKGPYNPQEVEPDILHYWLENKFYNPEYDPAQRKVIKLNMLKQQIRKGNIKPFCIVNPPPNANGRAHLGHMLGYTIQDLFLRYYRMKGYCAFGVPGKDHAGIQGEVVIERDFLKPKGKGKHNMSREEFYNALYKISTDLAQHARKDEQRIGLSSDFDRDVFTLDPDIVKIVLETFVKLHKDGLVYKGVRIINWCPSCKTTLADIDTEKKERTTDFVYIKYPLLNEDQKVWHLSFYNEKVIKVLLNGTKTIETRALNPEEPCRYFGDIKEGDIIVAVDKNADAHRATHPFLVKRVAIYKNLKELYEKEDQTKISSDGKNRTYEEFAKGYEKLADGYLEKINKNGIVAIEIEKLNVNSFDTFIIVATTRPETMLGDTAVVVNPKDKRYKHLIGRKVLLPLVWREIPIISDPIVDKDLGTGALKLTPAHAPEDYEIMLNWNSSKPKEKVDYINVINKQAKLCGPVGKYFGQDVNDACTQVIKDLQSLKLIEKIEQKEQMVTVCERCKTVIEPQMSSQWFIKMDSLKKNAIDAVKKGEINIYPTRMKKVYMNWLENLRDWAISRSLWWGYRFPVWYKGKVEEIINKEGKIINKINGIIVKDFDDAVKKGLAKVSIKPLKDPWIQSDYVFDTWFSSGQWAFAPLMKFGLLDEFYSTDIMETGYDILKLWVSRMVMLGLYRTGKVPFKHVYLHGLIKAADGQKMSKSKRNTVSPEEVVNEYGADVLRLFNLVGNKAGSGINFSNEKLEGNKRFLNKLWNASKFILMNLQDAKDIAKINENKVQLEKEDQDMLNKIKSITQSITQGIESFKFGVVLVDLMQSFWHDFCDWYIEKVKTRLYTKDKNGTPIDYDKNSRLAAQRVLYYSLKQYLKLLHPFIPFITERIWKEIPKTDKEHESIMFAKI